MLSSPNACGCLRLLKLYGGGAASGALAASYTRRTSTNTHVHTSRLCTCAPTHAYRNREICFDLKGGRRGGGPPIKGGVYSPIWGQSPPQLQGDSERRRSHGLKRSQTEEVFFLFGVANLDVGCSRCASVVQSESMAVGSEGWEDAQTPGNELDI